jgi:hypothetical protein
MGAVMKKKLRELGVKADGTRAIEPYCLDCVFDPYTGKSYCQCGLSYEQRQANQWKNGLEYVHKHH